MTDPKKDGEIPGSLTEIGLYKDPQDAQRAIVEDYNYWSGNLTASSLHMNYALIGANWIIFGSVNGILGSIWAKSSMLLVLIALVVNVLGSWILSELLRSRITYAEESYPRWKGEFKEAYGKRTTWPFTKTIDNLGKWLRCIKAGLTILSGIFLIVGALMKQVVPAQTVGH